MNADTQMIVRALPKRDTQAMIRALRAAKLTVEKDCAGMYSCDFEGARIFTAMPGRRNYLIRMRANLFA
jgi:hypothetical protein